MWGGGCAGCMAAQAALLYQEAPVGVFLPNSAEKAQAEPNSTSANRAAITSLIDVFSFLPHSRHVGLRTRMDSLGPRPLPLADFSSL